MPDDVAREALTAAGGLLNLTELAVRHGVAKTTMHAWTKRGGFPRPVHASGNSTVYIAGEVDEWINQRAPRADQ